MRACPYCDGEITNARAKTCGAADCKRKRQNDRCREWQSKNRDRANEIARKYRQGEAGKATAERAKADPKHLRRCVVCDAEWRTNRADARYCSSECYSSTLVGRRPTNAHTRNAKAKARLTVAARGTSGKRPWFVGACARCGVDFVSRRGSACCGNKCRSAMKAERRRALQHAAFVEPVRRAVVFRRDNYTCTLCGKPMDMNAVGPSPLAPTIDHVHPLARGGEHSMSNVQSAHFICNSMKSDQVS